MATGRKGPEGAWEKPRRSNSWKKFVSEHFFENSGEAGLPSDELESAAR